VPSNITEGQARQYTAEFRQFLPTALGSLAEVNTQIILANELGYVTDREADDIAHWIVEIRKMLYALQAHLPSAHKPPTTNHSIP
jgi:four helix bundle protein